MRSRLRSAVAWAAGGFLLGAAALAGGQGDENLREKLIEIERLSAQLRSLEEERTEVPAPSDKGLEFDRIPVADITAGATEFYRPRHVAPETSEMPLYSGPAEEAPQPFGTIEEIQELVRTSARPKAWEEGAQLTPQGCALLVYAKPDVSRDVRAFLNREIRPRVRRSVNLQVEIVEAPEPVATLLAAAVGIDLDPAARTHLEQAFAEGSARRLFAGRLRGRSRERVVLWHGAEEAVVPDADAEVATRSEAVDPVVDVEILGTSLQARSTVSDDEPTRVHVQIDLDHVALDRPIRTVQTAKTGTLQMPERQWTGVQADLAITNERWAVAAERTGADGKRRFLLLRPTAIGGAR
jgi:hypothetical protein